MAMLLQKLVVRESGISELKSVSIDNLSRILFSSASLKFGIIPVGQSVDMQVSVPKAQIGDPVLVSSSSNGIVVSAFVSETDTVTVRAFNVTTVDVDPTLTVYPILVIGT